MTRFNTHRSIECLEQKRMNAADLVGGMLGSAAGLSDTVHAAGASAGSGSAAADVAAAPNANSATHLSGALSGSGQGTVNLVSGMAHGSARTNLVLHVSGAPANGTFDVSVGGNVVGSLSTNANGNGILHLSSALHNADQLLAVLPTITADTNVSIGLSGATPILTGSLQAASNAAVGVLNANSVLNGAVQAGSNLGHGDNAAGIVGSAEHLTATAVDSLFGHDNDSNILGLVYGIVPVDVASLV